MTCGISSLPLEILEKILSNLQGESLIRVSKVCWQWACIAQRMMERANSTTFSSELLEDIQLDVREKLGEKMRDVYRETTQQVQIAGEADSVEVAHNIAAVEADGSSLYIGDIAGNLMVYELLDSGGSCPFLSPEPIVSTVLPDGPVVHLGLMKCRDLVSVVSPNTLYLFSTSKTPEGLVSLETVTPSIPIEHQGMVMRVHRDLIGVTEGASHLKVFRVLGVEGGVANMELVADFNTPCGVFRWKIWNNQVMCVLKTGALVVWDLLENDFSHVSEPYHELRYQNPCWMYQRYVLCSSELSRNLLCRYIYMMPTCPAAYWHISCGPSYWLFGRLDGKHTPEPEKYRGVLPPDVTTMCLRRRVFVCAKRMPNQLMVYLMPPSFPHDKDALTKTLQTPLLTLPAPEHVHMIDVAFLEDRVLVFTVSLPCLLHCYVLMREQVDDDLVSEPSSTEVSSEVAEGPSEVL